MSFSSDSIQNDSRFILDPIECKRNTAINLILEQLNLHGPCSVAISFNGGKDCTLLLGLLEKSLEIYSQNSVEIQGFYSKSESFPELEEFILYSQQRFKFLKMNSFVGNLKSNLNEFILKFPKIKAIFIGNRNSDPNSG